MFDYDYMLEDPVKKQLDDAVADFTRKLDNIGKEHPGWTSNKKLIANARKEILTRLDMREEKR